MAAKFGITAIPSMILVGKDGKIVAQNARGPGLAKALEKLLGPVEKKPAEASADEKKSEAKE